MKKPNIHKKSPLYGSGNDLTDSSSDFEEKIKQSKQPKENKENNVKKQNEDDVKRNIEPQQYKKKHLFFQIFTSLIPKIYKQKKKIQNRK